MTGFVVFAEEDPEQNSVVRKLHLSPRWDVIAFTSLITEGGAVAEPQIERRLAAILAADVAGYSRLTGQDEEGTLRQLRVLRNDLIDPMVSAHRGHIIKSTGDGLLVEFVSVVDALRLALELQGKLAQHNLHLPKDKQINFRIGINVGDVVVESDGDLMGDAVNIAARLEGIAPVGGISLSAAAYDQVKHKIEIAVEDKGRQRLKNIAEPVRVFNIEPANPSARLTWRTSRLIAITAGLLIAIAAIATGAWYLRGGSGAVSTAVQVPAPSPKATAMSTRRPQSIIVLPFANLSDAAQQDYFADGLTEDLTTDLSRISGSFVISRNTAFTFKGRAVNATTVGRELDVRYVLEGSVQRSGNQIRINAQLIDAETGAHLWADRFDYELSDLLKLQNVVTGRIAHTLSLELVDAESARARRERPNNPEAIDLLMQARAIWLRTGQGQDKAVARDLFRRALERDDTLASAWSGLAFTYVQDSRFSPTRDDDLQEAAKAVERAIQLDPKDANGYAAKGILDAESGHPELALVDQETAVALDRNRAGSWAQLGAVMVWLGRPQEAFAYLDRAIELSPRDPALPIWYLFGGSAYLHLREDSKAIEWLEKSKRLNPRAQFPHLYLASVLALAGREDEARLELKEFLKINPNFTLARMKASEVSSNAVYLEQRQRIYEGLAKAGLPER